MAQSYVTEGTLVICTEMKTVKNNVVIAYRNVKTVKHSSKKALLLNKQDLKLEDEFVCNINSKFWAGLKMLATVVAVGALAVATVATGGLALVALAVAAAAVVTDTYSTYKEIFHKCDETKNSKWIGYHPSVKIDGDNALLQSSNLICNKGGALTLMIDPVQAKEASQKIAYNNSKEYQKHLESQSIQSTIFTITSAGNPIDLVISFPFAVWDYTKGENEKIAKRAAAIEDVIIEKKDVEVTSVIPSLDDVDNVVKDLGRDKVIGWGQNAVLGYSSIVISSVKSGYPMAALSVNSSIYIGAASNSIKKSVGELATKKGILKAGKSLG